MASLKQGKEKAPGRFSNIYIAIADAAVQFDR
jgi:hypothetical protein